MIRYSIFILLSIFFLSGCSSIKVQSDYEVDYDFKQLKSYSVLSNMDKTLTDITAKRLDLALSKKFTELGYTKVPKEQADFYIVYHTEVKTKTRIDTDYQTLGMYPYRYGRSMSISTSTRVREYEVGQLIIDIMDSKTKTIISRGIAEDRIKKFKNPQERMAYINKVVQEIISKMHFR